MGGWPRCHRRSADTKGNRVSGALFHAPPRNSAETAGMAAVPAARKSWPGAIQSGPLPRLCQLSNCRKSLKMSCRPALRVRCVPTSACTRLSAGKRPAGSWRFTGGARQPDPGGEHGEELRHADAGGRAGVRSASRRQRSNPGRPGREGGALAGGHPARRGARGRQAICPRRQPAGGQPGLQRFRSSRRSSHPGTPQPGISPGCQAWFRDWRGRGYHSPYTSRVPAMYLSWT